MKTIAALIAGLLLSAMTFVAGLATALIFLNAGDAPHRPAAQETATLWTDRPVAVDKDSQSFERVPARPVPKQTELAPAMHKAGAGTRGKLAVRRDMDPVAEERLVDPVTTAAIDRRNPENETSRIGEQAAAHLQWCARRYRSYRAEDNSYRPFGGGRRPCESPYSNIAQADPPGEVIEQGNVMTSTSDDRPTSDGQRPEMEPAAFDDEAAADVDSYDHVRSCFARYRSYRPEDNSYQPYDGGPRRQCR